MRPASERGVRRKVALGGLTDCDAARFFSKWFVAAACDPRLSGSNYSSTSCAGASAISSGKSAPRFNLVRFRWFKNEFIHPTKLKTVYKGESLNHLFGGFSTEGR
jgi:hypothetical protein